MVFFKSNIVIPSTAKILSTVLSMVGLMIIFVVPHIAFAFSDVDMFPHISAVFPESGATRVFFDSSVASSTICSGGTGSPLFVKVFVGSYPSTSTLATNGTYVTGTCSNVAWTWGLNGSIQSGVLLAQNTSAVFPNGSYNLRLDASGKGNNYYLNFTITSGAAGDLVVGGTDTRIITVTPTNGSTIASSTTNVVGSTGYLNTADLDDYSNLHIHLENSAVSFQNCADAICAELARNALSLDFDYPLTTASPYVYSSTTQGLPLGMYWVTTSIQKGSYCFLGVCAFTQTIVASSSTFTVATTTRADRLKGSVKTYFDSLTSTTEDFASCTISSLASFDFFNCMADLIAYAFVPTPDAIDYLANSAHEDIITHFPLGYVSDFISILATSTVGTLPVIDTSIPSGMFGTGSHVHLDLTHSLDYILNATTTGRFSTASTTSQTFFEYTNGYWQKVLYVLAFFYILSRILGSGIIPHGHRGRNTKIDDN